MNKTAFTDPELLELFDGEPELLAIADAVTATTARVDLDPVRSARRRPIAQLFTHHRRMAIVAVLLVAAAAAAPAFAFSPSVRELVGFSEMTRLPPAHYVVATVKVQSITKPAPYALPLARITFTVSEPGKPPGTGIRHGAYFLVFVSGSNGPPSDARAYGKNGYYQATVWVPSGDITKIEIGGFMNASPSPADGEFWVPVKVKVSQQNP